MFLAPPEIEPTKHSPLAKQRATRAAAEAARLKQRRLGRIRADASGLAVAFSLAFSIFAGAEQLTKSVYGNHSRATVA